MGHIGLTPQSVHKMGGYVVQGKDSDKAQQILEDARALEAAGCYAIVLEGIPAELARGSHRASSASPPSASARAALRRAGARLIRPPRHRPGLHAQVREAVREVGAAIQGAVAAPTSAR